MKQYHELKTWPEFYNAITSGEKEFEIRRNDRGFKVDDVLILREWCPESKKYTGNASWLEVSYILKDFQYEGLCQGFCIMSLRASDIELDTILLVAPELATCTKNQPTAAQGEGEI